MVFVKYHTLICIFQVVIHLIPPTLKQGTYYYFPHIINEEIGGEKLSNLPRVPELMWAEQEFKPSCLAARV